MSIDFNLQHLIWIVPSLIVLGLVLWFVGMRRGWCVRLVDEKGERTIISCNMPQFQHDCCCGPRPPDEVKQLVPTYISEKQKEKLQLEESSDNLNDKTLNPDNLALVAGAGGAAAALSNSQKEPVKEPVKDPQMGNSVKMENPATQQINTQGERLHSQEQLNTQQSMHNSQMMPPPPPNDELMFKGPKDEKPNPLNINRNNILQPLDQENPNERRESMMNSRMMTNPRMPTEGPNGRMPTEGPNGRMPMEGPNGRNLIDGPNERIAQQGPNNPNQRKPTEPADRMNNSRVLPPIPPPAPPMEPTPPPKQIVNPFADDDDDTPNGGPNVPPPANNSIMIVDKPKKQINPFADDEDETPAGPSNIQSPPINGNIVKINPAAPNPSNQPNIMNNSVRNQIPPLNNNLNPGPGLGPGNNNTLPINQRPNVNANPVAPSGPVNPNDRQVVFPRFDDAPQNNNILNSTNMRNVPGPGPAPVNGFSNNTNNPRQIGPNSPPPPSAFPVSNPNNGPPKRQFVGLMDDPSSNNQVPISIVGGGNDRPGPQKNQAPADEKPLILSLD